MPFGESFCFTLLTVDPARAAAADRAGVNRIGIDRERLGKRERQAGRDTRVSTHDWDDLRAIREVVERGALFARINPLHPGTAEEVETALQLGVRVLMLPCVRSAEEACAFISMVRGRAIVSILIETAPAIVRIRSIVDVPGIDEIMVGLNDLHIQTGVANHFEVLASPLLDMLAAETRRRGLPLSIGGLGKPEDDSLPIPADLVYAQYSRLGATGAWIARSFDRSGHSDFGAELPRMRQRLTNWAERSPAEWEEARAELALRAAAWRP